MPLLAAFSGARPTELTQLRKEDLRIEAGRWIMRITPKAGSVKTGQFSDVPLDPQLVSLGFADYSQKPQLGRCVIGHLRRRNRSRARARYPVRSANGRTAWGWCRTVFNRTMAFATGTRLWALSRVHPFASSTRTKAIPEGPPVMAMAT